MLRSDAPRTMRECGVPEYMHGAILRFYNDGLHPGSFLAAVINNDLRGAIAKADETNMYKLPNYIRWFYNYAPGGSWGRPNAVEEYIKRFHEQKERDNERN